MSAQDPNSLLTTAELLALSNFRRGTADDLDTAISELPDISITAGTGLTGGGDLSVPRTISLANTAVTPAAYANANITVDQQGRITGASNGTSGGGINVKLSPYNAVGDGAADDAAAISSAIVAGVAAGSPVYFPPGTYKINSTIVITGNNVSLNGAGSSSVIRFASNTRDAFQIVTGSNTVEVHHLFFQGDSSDDKDVNLYAGLQISNGGGITTDLGVTDISVHHCTFDHCTPLESDDSFHTGRLHFYKNYIHNAPNGVHPPSNTTIEDNDFVNDSYIASRAEFIYSYGQQVNQSFLNNRFKNGTAQDIQIRSTNPRFNQRANFRIIGNHFENSAQYSIWAGSDDHPDIGQILITGNTFRNCASPVNVRGDALITANNFEWDFENPNALVPGGGTAIGAAGGGGVSGAQSTPRGVVISHNRFVHRQPWLGKVAIDTAPSDGDTLTVGAFTYTWKTSAISEGHIQINANTTTCATNLVATIRGLDGLMTAPCNVLRNVNDCFSNALASANSESNGNLVVITSWQTFTLSKSSSHMTLTAPVDYRDACTYSVNVNSVICPVIDGNHGEDFNALVAVSQCYAPQVLNNTLSVSCQNTGARVIVALANVKSFYNEGNRLLIQQPIEDVVGNYDIISDAFPVIELPYRNLPQLAVPSCGGRAGIVPVGDGIAYMYLYFGQELAASTAAYTRPWRWDDGDTLAMSGGQTFKFKRSSPGANQFNDIVSLLALINGGVTMTAATETLTNDYAATDPKVWVKIKAAAGGTGGNAYTLYVQRFKKPSDSSTYTTVPQPLINGTILRKGGEEFARFYGGAATRTKTFVHSPIANADTGVYVCGIDAASNALDPVIYRADIVPGVGFTITHGVAAGTESFFWRVN